MTVCVGLLWATTAFAQTKAEKEKAKAHFRQGQGHFNLREFPEALEEFKEAYRVTNDPTLLFNIAQCQYKVGDFSGALYSYRAYLRNGKDVPNRADVEARIKELEERVSFAPAQTATAETSQAAAPSAASFVPDPPPPAADKTHETTPAAVLQPAPEAAKTPAPSAAISPVVTKPKQGSTRRSLRWTAAGLAAAGLGAGTAFALTALSKKSQADDYCNSNDYCSSQKGLDFRHEAVVRGNIATAFFILGGVGLAAAGGLWLWTPSNESGGMTVGVAPQSITIGGHF